MNDVYRRVLRDLKRHTDLQPLLVAADLIEAMAAMGVPAQDMSVETFKKLFGNEELRRVIDHHATDYRKEEV